MNDTLYLLLTYGLIIGVWLYSLYDILSGEFVNSSQKRTWALIVFFIPFIGLIAYWMFGRKSRIL